MSNDAAWAMMVNHLSAPESDPAKNVDEQSLTDLSCVLVEMTLLKGVPITYNNFHQSNTKKNV